MTYQRYGLLLVLVAALSGNVGAVYADDTSKVTEHEMNIRLVFEDMTLDATLEDSVASREFAGMLPLNLTLSDYNGTEKVADLSGRLSLDGSPDGVDPKIGDITYYSPWGNLAIFYRDFPYARGLVRLGHIKTGVENLAGHGELKVRIERVD